MNPFLIACVGDLHLGRRTYDLTERIRDHAAVLPQINALISGQDFDPRPDLICVLGDAYDNSSPDSFSCDAFRRFVETLPKFSPLIALTGNHDRERLDLGMTRVRSLAGNRILQPGIHEIDAMGDVVKVLALDWMPAAAIAARLAEISDDSLDILCLHQSVEGLMPTIGEPEVKLAQLAGKARVVLVGDLHVNKTVQAGPDTVVISCGSTEQCTIDEDPNKVIKLVEYDTEIRRINRVVDLPLKTRPILKETVASEEDFKAVRSSVSSGYGKSLHTLMVTEFAPEFFHRANELAALAKASGHLFVARQAARVEVGETFVDLKISADTELQDIIAARHPDDRERQAALALWQNPENVDAITDSLLSSFPSHEPTLAPTR